jgi:hypothetical protein
MSTDFVLDMRLQKLMDSCIGYGRNAGFKNENACAQIAAALFEANIRVRLALTDREA